MKSTKAFE